MGIDLWVDKNSALLASAQTSPAVASLATGASAADSNPPARLAELSATEFVAAIDDLMITCREPVRSAELLVVTEGSGLTEGCRKLLDSMFKAIKLDSKQWFQAEIFNPLSETAANLNDTVNSSHISEIEKSVDPKALVFLLRTSGSKTALDDLRSLQHQSRALQSFVVVSFHPQDLLDNPDAKRPAWEDLKQLRQWLS